MAFVAKGAPMLAVCESTGPAPFLGVGVPWDSPVKTLAGSERQDHRRLEPGLVQRLVRPRAGAQFGWGANGVKTVAIGGGPAPIARRRCAPIWSMP